MTTITAQPEGTVAPDPDPSAETDPHPHLAEVRSLAHELLRLQRRRTAAYRGTVLEASAFRLLWLLSDGRARTLRELATELDLEQSTVNRQVNAAIEAGYLERFEVAGSVSRPVRPTRAGTEAYEHDGLLRGGLIRAALDELGDERVARLVDDLRAYNDALDAVVSRD